MRVVRREKCKVLIELRSVRSLLGEIARYSIELRVVRRMLGEMQGI